MLTYAAHNVGLIEFDGSQPVARGPKIAEFEKKLTAITGARHAIAVNSGTSALYLAVMACGLAGKRVAVPSITFCGTANAVLMAGGTPVFAEVGMDGNIDIDWLIKHDAEWDGVIPVHYAGNLCDMEALKNIAGTRPIIADACHALGGFKGVEYADAACLSFHPAKQITTGEGGAILTDDEVTAFRLRCLRNNGMASVYDGGVRQNLWATASLNFWMSDIAASIGTKQLDKLHGWLSERKIMAARYQETLPIWAMPVVKLDGVGRYAWCMYPVLLDLEKLGIPRYGLMVELLRREIETQIHYQPLHLQPMGKGKIGDLPMAEDFGARELTLPLHNKMGLDDVLRVCAALKEIHG